MLAGAFVGVRALAFALGLRFDASQTAAFWHFIEPELLRTRLLESLVYLHAQPPLFNLWLGLYVKAFGAWMPVAFALSFLALGVALAVQMNALARALGVGGWTRTIGVAVVCTSPAVLLYENFLLYAYPVAVLLAWSAVRLHRALESGRERDWWVFCGMLTAIVLMRALYHPLWLVTVLAGSGFALQRLRGRLRPLARPALVATLLVGAVLAKNGALFGHATLSTFSGMNLSRTVLDRMEWDDLKGRVDAGTLSTWALTGGFQPLSDYWPAPPAQPTGVPLLDRPLKAEGSINLHHRAYIDISDQLQRDALAVVRAEPAVYLRSVWLNVQQTLHPASTYVPLEGARAQIAPLVRVYEPALGWIPWLGPMGIWPVLLPLVLLTSGILFWHDRVDRDARLPLVVYMTFTIVYVVGVGALMERSENQRFRFDVDPFIWVLFLVVLERTWRAVSGRRAIRPGPR